MGDPDRAATGPRAAARPARSPCPRAPTGSYVPAAGGYAGAVSKAVTLTDPTVKALLARDRSKSKLKVNVNPNKGSGYWTFRVQKRNANGTWSTLGTTYRTKGRGRDPHGQPAQGHLPRRRGRQVRLQGRPERRGDPRQVAHRTDARGRPRWRPRASAFRSPPYRGPTPGAAQRPPNSRTCLTTNSPFSRTLSSRSSALGLLLSAVTQRQSPAVVVALGGAVGALDRLGDVDDLQHLVAAEHLRGAAGPSWRRLRVARHGEAERLRVGDEARDRDLRERAGVGVGDQVVALLDGQRVAVDASVLSTRVTTTALAATSDSVS